MKRDKLREESIEEYDLQYMRWLFIASALEVLMLEGCIEETTYHRMDNALAYLKPINPEDPE